MKLNARNWSGLALVLSSAVTGFSADAMEPQTLFNFQLSLGTVTGTLVQGPDGNFYGTTAQGGPLGSGTVFRVTPAGILTTLVSDQANPAAGLIVGNDGLLYGNRVGSIAEEEGHHPDIFLAWGKVKLTIWTHVIGGLSENDFILAAKADAVRQ